MQRRPLLFVLLMIWSICSFSQDSGTVSPGPVPGFDVQRYRTYDGTYNNLNNPDWGAAGTNLLRISGIGYQDGISEPGGQDRPNPRYVSNEVFAQDGLMNDRMGLSDYCWVWGQFIDHDMGLTPDGNEPQGIRVPRGDRLFDPFNTGEMVIPMVRNVFDPETGTGPDNPRQHPNLLTAFIDGSGVYGSDEVTANWLRTFTGGKLKVTADNMMPFNTVTGEYDSEIDPNAPHMDNPVRLSEKLHVAGDPRANENPLLLSFHTLFVREHNRLCDELAAAHPDWDDEQLYQHARKIVGGIIQSIVYNEWLPVMGVRLRPYSGYDATVHPQLANVFTAAAFRLGHTLLNGNIIRMDNEGEILEGGNLELRDAFFNVMVVDESGGIEPFLKGMGTQIQQGFDARVIDDVRNFLFGPPGAGGLDLAAINMNRGRERGLPDFNTVRAAYGLPRYFFFQQMNWDYNVLIKMVKLYKNVNKVDPWVGMLVERPRPNQLFGETIMKIMEHQFGASRDGDRFFYENDPVLNSEEKAMIRNTKMYDVVMRNTSIELMQRDVFRAMPHNQICKERFGAVKGRVVSVSGAPIPGVSVVTSSVNDQLNGQSNQDGVFNIEEIPGCDEFNLTMRMSDLPNKGINTLDLIRIQKFILGLGGFDSPHQMLAADVNRSASITTSDLLMVRKIILGLPTNLNEDELWMFIPEKHTFQNLAAPYDEELPVKMELGVMKDKEVEESFIGIKLGDVDFSAFPASSVPRSERELMLLTENIELEAGKRYEIILNAEQSAQLAGLQMALGFDSEALSFEGILSSVLTEFGVDNYNVTDGVIRLSWNAAEARELSEGADLFRIAFTAKQSGRLSDWIYLDRGLSPEAYDARLNTSGIKIGFGESAKPIVEKGFDLYQNQPNPFTTETYMPFYISKGGQVRLTVFDLMGRRLVEKEADLQPGYHQFMLSSYDLSETGAMFYQLETPEGTLTKEMLRL